VEEKDNGPGLRGLLLSDQAPLQAVLEPGLLGGVTTLVGQAIQDESPEQVNELYQTVDFPAKPGNVPFKAIPYFAWSNRGEGEMQVWVRRSEA
jgi:DUF1680 family protein